MGGNFLFLNVLILGALCASDVANVEIGEVREAIKQLSPGKFAEANLKVLNLGYDALL